MPKKTPEQKARDRERKAELYKLGRSLGLSAKDAKQASKVKAEQDRRAMEAAKRKARTPKQPKQPKPKPTKTLPGPQRLAKTPKQRKSPQSYEDFVRQHTELKSARAAMKAFRDQTGGSVSSKVGYRSFTEIRSEQRQLDDKYIKKHYEKVRFRIYGRDDAPARIHPPYKNRFYYFVVYEVRVDGQPEPFEQYMWITNRTPLKPVDVIRAVFDSFQVGQDTGIERYKALRILPDSIRILYAIDTDKRRAG